MDCALGRSGPEGALPPTPGAQAGRQLMPGAFAARMVRRVTGNWPMKLTALALAAVLWAAVAAEEPSTQRVAITLRVTAPEGRPLTRSLPTIHGVFAGPARELLKLYASPP